MNQKQKTRRTFLKDTTLLSTAVAFPTIWTQAGTQQNPNQKNFRAGEKVNVACVGIGNQGAFDIQQFHKTGLANFVAFCDVDMGAAQTLPILKQFPDVPRFQDFRVMFDKMGSKIDAVLIGTPDFSHFAITMLAMSLGKHVYVEKPMARTFNEVELMMKGAKKYGVVTQMGNQGHSEANYFQFKTWVDAGIIKDVTKITAHMNSPRRWHGWQDKYKSYPAAEPKPDTLDWDIWTNVAKEHDYNKDLVNGQWRCWYDYGMGALGDWGAHLVDTAHEFLNLGLPSEVSMLKAEYHNDFFYPQSSTIQFRFPKRGKMPACDITWYDGVNNLPPLPEGYGSATKVDANIPPPGGGSAAQGPRLSPGKIIYGKDLTFKGGSHGSTLSIIPEERAKEMAASLPAVPVSPSNHYANFLKACKGEEKTRSSFEIAGPLSQVFCLGVLSQWLNTTIKFDRKKKVITNNKLANQLLVGAPPRKGWEQYYNL